MMKCKYKAMRQIRFQRHTKQFRSSFELEPQTLTAGRLLDHRHYRANRWNTDSMWSSSMKWSRYLSYMI